MIRHFLKLTWNRRRSNGLIMVELTVSFLVLCAALTMACYYGLNWSKPLGFAYEDLWRLDIEYGNSNNVTEASAEETKARYRQLDLMLAAMPEIAAHSPLDPNFPYTNTSSMLQVDINGVPTFVGMADISRDALATFGFELTAGRWFEPGDEILSWKPVVITEDIATDMGGLGAVGELLVVSRSDQEGQGEEAEKAMEHRIIGIVSEYRMRSELRPAYPTVFSLVNLDDMVIPPSVIGIRVNPGVTAEFEEKLQRAVLQTAPDWTIGFTPSTRLRSRELRANLIPLTILSTIAGFLILMVGLGLVGVLWQAVTRRTEELGVRRALGATREQVRWQILGELLVLTTISVFLGSLIFIQMPLLQAIAWIPWSAYLLSLALSIMIIYPFVILCGLYPCWLATRIHPAFALQCE